MDRNEVKVNKNTKRKRQISSHLNRTSLVINDLVNSKKIKTFIKNQELHISRAGKERQLCL